ncbi:MAG: pyridoxamine 5'-phosphate oxidase family protein [Sedimentisphaerales bacterium]|nr:pyridoxamine 5'-phosphate oxidase family protein [Sedimentisphaerales bacterium]
MNLSEYFEKVKGTGVLATADKNGLVDIALYARPHIIDNTTAVFVMRERLSHANLKTNHHVAYLFREDASGYKGVRLYLTLEREETNTALIKQFRRRDPDIYSSEDDSSKFLVFFHIDRVRQLVGADDLNPNSLPQ